MFSSYYLFCENKFLIHQGKLLVFKGAFVNYQYHFSAAIISDFSAKHSIIIPILLNHIHLQINKYQVISNCNIPSFESATDLSLQNTNKDYSSRKIQGKAVSFHCLRGSKSPLSVRRRLN